MSNKTAVGSWFNKKPSSTQDPTPVPASSSSTTPPPPTTTTTTPTKSTTAAAAVSTPSPKMIHHAKSAPTAVRGPTPTEQKSAPGPSTPVKKPATATATATPSTPSTPKPGPAAKPTTPASSSSSSPAAKSTLNRLKEQAESAKKQDAEKAAATAATAEAKRKKVQEEKKAAEAAAAAAEEEKRQKEAEEQAQNENSMLLSTVVEEEEEVEYIDAEHAGVGMADESPNPSTPLLPEDPPADFNEEPQPPAEAEAEAEAEPEPEPPAPSTPVVTIAAVSSAPSTPVSEAVKEVPSSSSSAPIPTICSQLSTLQLQDSRWSLGFSILDALSARLDNALAARNELLAKYSGIIMSIPGCDEEQKAFMEEIDAAGKSLAHIRETANKRKREVEQNEELGRTKRVRFDLDN